ncbi:hypothetical protein EMCRGX_G010796 [Ephydatia muelleri]
MADDDVPDKEAFYHDAQSYWEKVPSTVEGVMGGFGRLSHQDIKCSKEFLLPFIQGPGATVKTSRALDCGAGIGRVSKLLLLPLFSEVDLEEQNPAFLEKARVYLKAETVAHVKNYYAVGLQDFTPPEAWYDVIWVQWVMAHLTDEDFVSFLRRATAALTPNGLIVVKENIAKDEDIFEEDDSSITRCMQSFHRLFSMADLRIVKQENQTKFPQEMYQITMFALQPTKSAVHTTNLSDVSISV